MAYGWMMTMFASCNIFNGIMGCVNNNTHVAYNDYYFERGRLEKYTHGIYNGKTVIMCERDLCEIGYRRPVWICPGRTYITWDDYCHYRGEVVIYTQAANDHVYVYCETCRRWVKRELGRRLPRDRWICNDCDATRRARKEKKDE